MLSKSYLYIALIIFGIGLIYKVSTWFRYNLDTGIKRIGTFQRIFSSMKGLILTIFSLKILTLLKTFFLDVLFQRRIFRESPLRWTMHMCIFIGFMLLLLMHALEDIVTTSIFRDYESTLNPFLFLRTFFGLMVIAGLIISFYRRHILKISRLISNAMDHYAVIILAVIMVSGFMLEAVKITSYTSYHGMVEDYADFDDEESLNALESYWVEKYGVVSPNQKGPFDSDLLTLGEELNEMNCLACHSRPQWAFISYGVAKAIKPFAVGLDGTGIPNILWNIHFLACLLGLAYLPFSRMFHIITSPLCLMINSVMDENSDPANVATKQIIELDSCTHCGTCSTQCLVGVAYEEIGNENILPSEKLVSVRKLAAGKKLQKEDLKNIQEGLCLCTNCQRCSLVCPAGINLQDLWFNVRESILKRGYPEPLILSPFSFYRGLKRNDIAQEHYKGPVEKTKEIIEQKYSSFVSREILIHYDETDKAFIKDLRKSLQGNTFFNCFTCTTCSSVCPVIKNFEDPHLTMDLSPHQIIHAAIVGVPDMIFRSRMLWSCLGCYQCQEACPQGVQITDIFYELKNIAISRLEGNGRSLSGGEL